MATLVLAALLSLGTAAWAQGSDALNEQLATAMQHAEFSMGADDVAGATTHLGHVLNCIAGEGGEGFDGDWGHPCAGQGDGILNDLASHPNAAELTAVLNAAHALAMEGVMAESVGAAQAASAGVHALLSVIADHGG
ncbi:MAG: hypothetical protein WD336_01550 [Trueperaceae bacterium]